MHLIGASDSRVKTQLWAIVCFAREMLIICIKYIIQFSFEEGLINNHRPNVPTFETPYGVAADAFKQVQWCEMHCLWIFGIIEGPKKIPMRDYMHKHLGILFGADVTRAGLGVQLPVWVARAADVADVDEDLVAERLQR